MERLCRTHTAVITLKQFKTLNIKDKKMKKFLFLLVLALFAFGCNEANDPVSTNVETPLSTDSLPKDVVRCVR